MLECSVCGRTYSDRWRCDCGGPLEFADRPLPDGPPDVDPREGLWAFRAFIPVTERVTLGEGWTPLVDAPDWDASFKLEYVLPTGSFKDRGATTTLSRAADLGVDRVLEDSSGNAGAAIATYAARGGIPAEIYVPADAKASKLRAIRRTGADVVRVEGDRQAVTDACIEAVEAGEGWYASHAWNPAFFAGTATVAYEIAAQRDWSVPDAVVAPVGHGTLFLGLYRGFRALRAAGWTDRLPRLLGAQAAGYAPIAGELHGEADGRIEVENDRDCVEDDDESDDGGDGDDGGDEDGRNEVADGIQIRDPVRTDQILAAVEATDGDAIALDEPAVEAALDRLHRTGFYTEPTSAVAPAALAAYRERGVVAADDDVVVPLTGSGLKG